MYRQAILDTLKIKRVIVNREELTSKKVIHKNLIQGGNYVTKERF